MLPSTAGSPAKDTNRQPVGQIQCPQNRANVGPNSNKSFLIIMWYTDWTGYFKVDNKIHKPLHSQAHKADLLF